MLAFWRDWRHPMPGTPSQSKSGASGAGSFCPTGNNWPQALQLCGREGHSVSSTIFVAFARRSLFLRRLAMFGVAAKIARCFFVDTTGLVGLIRAASLSGLGLSRAGLAWINRRMTDQNNLY